MACARRILWRQSLQFESRRSYPMSASSTGGHREGTFETATRAHQVFLPIFDDLAESLKGQQAGGAAATHTFVQDADETAVCHNGHGASDSAPGEIEPRSAEIGEIALDQRPGSGAPADFTRRRLSMASGMTMEAHEA